MTTTLAMTCLMLVAAAPPAPKGLALLEEQIARHGFTNHDGAQAIYLPDARNERALAVARSTKPARKTVLLQVEASGPAAVATCDDDGAKWCDDLVDQHAKWAKQTPPDLIVLVPASETQIVPQMAELLEAFRTVRGASPANHNVEYQALFRNPKQWAAVLAWVDLEPGANHLHAACRLAGDPRTFRLICQRTHRAELAALLRNFPLAPITGDQFLICFGERGQVVHDQTNGTLDIRLDGAYAALQPRLGGTAAPQLVGFQRVDLARIDAARRHPAWARFDDVQRASNEHLIKSIACRDDDHLGGFSAVSWFLKP